MNVRRKFAVLTLLFVFLAALACKNNDLYEPESTASDKGARSSLSDTVSVVEKPTEPVKEEETNIPPPDTASVSEKPREPVSVSLADEKFVIKAKAPDSLENAIIVLTFISEQNLGCGDSYFIIQPQSEENSPFDMRIGDLVLPNDCTQKFEKAMSTVFLYPVPKGENILRIRIGGKSFEGKIIREDTRYVFEWPDESQFRFSDKVLNF